MGNFLSGGPSPLLRREKIRVVMTGLDCAGSTAILYRLKLGEFVVTIPTIGFNIETISWKNTAFHFHDVSGQYKLRNMAQEHLENIQGFIFVVDSSDPDRFPQAWTELHRLVNQEALQGVPMLVYANKSDLHDATDASEIIKLLALDEVKSSPWHCESSSAVTGKGLTEGLEWLATRARENGR